MLLAIDVGNSHIVIGCYEDTYIRHVIRMVTDDLKTEDEYAAEIQNIFHFNNVVSSDFTGAILSSVVPTLTGVFLSSIKKLTGLTALLVGAGIKTGLNILIDNPAELGSDMATTAVAAVAKYHVPVIVVDMGTATKISVVNKNGAFIGGAICPGLAISADALFREASLLPRVSIEAPKKSINSNTVDCIKSGLVLGAASMIDGMVVRFSEELEGTPVVVATGGLAGRVIPFCKTEIVHDDNLLLDGLRILFAKNTEK